MRTDPSFIARGCTHHTILPSFLPALQSNAVDTSLWRMIPFFLFLFGSSLCCDVTVWKVAEGLIANRRNPRNETPDPTHAELPFFHFSPLVPFIILIMDASEEEPIEPSFDQDEKRSIFVQYVSTTQS
jgi:hypothetical protein